MSGDRQYSLKRFVDWWRVNLAESLPESLRQRWQGLRNRHDFIIVHLGDELLVRNRRGDLLEQISLMQTEPDLMSDTRLDIDLGDSVVPMAGRRMPAAGKEDVPFAAEATATLQTPEDNTARVIELSRHRGEITQLLDENGNLQKEAVETTQLFFFQNGQIQTVDPERKSEDKASAHQAIDFELLGNEQEQARRRLRELLQKYLRKGRCVYLIPPQRLLSLRLDYSSKARDRIDTVLRYDLEKHMPLGLDEIRYFHACRLDEQGERIRVDVEIIKREDHAELVETLGDLAARGLGVSTLNLHRNHHAQIGLQPESSPGFSLHRVRWSTLVWGFNFALLVALLAMPFWLIERQKASMSQVTPERVAEAGRIQAEKRQLEKLAQVDAALRKEASKYPRVLPLLSLLSEHLDPQAWLHDFQLEGNDIRIKGEAESASRVSDDLYRSKAFDDIRFVSSIVRNAASGKEAFEIAMKVKADD